jgi:hypothetical protein
MPYINKHGVLEECLNNEEHSGCRDKSISYGKTTCLLGRMYAQIGFPSNPIFSGDYSEFKIASGGYWSLDIPLFEVRGKGIVPKNCTK